jgi:hypothetical protein
MHGTTENLQYSKRGPSRIKSSAQRVSRIIYYLSLLCCKAFIMLFLGSLSTSAALPKSTHELFSYDWHNKNPLVIFHYKAGDINSISSARIVFLASYDCKDGYITHYKTAIASKGFAINPSEDFALLTQTAYEAAIPLLNPEKIFLIHSILISFYGSHGEKPRFLTGCSDEGTNCCISVVCFNNERVCYPKYEFPRQSFILFADYE